MTNHDFYQKILIYLEKLCQEIPERCVGSEGNLKATRFFEAEISALGWETEMTAFEAIDWKENGAILKSNGHSFHVLVSPYSLGFKGEAESVSASNVSELESLDCSGKIIFLHGEIAKEQLMPKNFVFYNPERHRKIVALLEKSGAKAIVCATGRNSALAGGVYPFPLIEDGDFNIPSVYMTEEEGVELLPHIGKTIFLESVSKRLPSKGYNVIGRKGDRNSKKIVLTAHIDAKKGAPGAIDNATGVIVLLLLADLLKDYRGDKQIEIVAFNGEDYYAAPGQMNYVMANQDKFKNILLNINIDGAGFKTGKSSFSFFDMPEEIQQTANEILQKFDGITEGIQWPQGDHSIFLQYGVPAIAVSSKWLIDHLGEQDITHTPKDNMEIVDCNKVVEISQALNSMIRKI
ncbi:MAG: M28 family peptidase [Bacteroidales bacterium]|nr:M28 family peptidase [Bacteroidales bacterium]